jgi:hypothetical protein
MILKQGCIIGTVRKNGIAYSKAFYDLKERFYQQKILMAWNGN